MTLISPIVLAYNGSVISGNKLASSMSLLQLLYTTFTVEHLPKMFRHASRSSRECNDIDRASEVIFHFLTYSFY